jgi:alkanesulfonate monooxygenase SsuD/methylene tetrahydromethanopterin reductase-like flavin-dependent oxidoreductase (luciferase family)
LTPSVVPALEFEISYNLRNPEQWRRPWADLYQEMLEQVAWADQAGFDRVCFNEHHFSPDGYLPSPMTAAAAVAARTRRIRICLRMAVLTFRHPIQVAEEIAVLDILSGGRLEVGFGAGYRKAEFDAFGISLADRPSRMREAIEIVRRCWEEEVFDFEGRHWRLRGVRATPKPVQQPRPRIAMGGHSVAAARRAARIADAFATRDQGLLDEWRAEARRVGRPADPRVTLSGSSPGLPTTFVHVAADPAAAWARIGPHAAYETSAYAAWTQELDYTDYIVTDDPGDLLRAGTHGVLTPEETVAICSRPTPGPDSPRRLSLQPMMGGMPAELGWECLELVKAQVMPRFAPQPAIRKGASAGAGT